MMAWSLEHGPASDEPRASHLKLWHDIVNAQPNAIALISRHQSPQDFGWVGSQRVETEYLTWTFADLDRGARRLATSLNKPTPIQRQPIAALVNNQAEWALLYWASAYLHSPFVPINPKCALRAEDINYMISFVRPAVIVATDRNIASHLEQSLSEKLLNEINARYITGPVGGETRTHWSPLSDILCSELTPPYTPDEFAATDTLAILFTSGTTALPKPCALTSAQCLNAAFGCMAAHEVASCHRFVQHLPGFHSYGIGWSLSFWLRGGTIVYPSAHFEPQASLECIDLFKATHMSLVPTTAQAILAHPAFFQTNIDSLVSLDISGAGVLPSLVTACTQAFKVPVCTSYGMTESPGTLAWSVDAGSVIRNGLIMSGRPVQGAVVKVCEPGTQKVLPRGQIGELHNGGLQVISNYMDPTLPTQDFYQDRSGTQWIITGDQAVMDHDGAVRICGRYKDMIIRGGENISPVSIEEVLMRQDSTCTAQVVGVPDDVAGEVPIAVIITVGSHEADMDELKEATTKSLGPAFAPKIILDLKRDLGLAAFPITATGKVKKVELARIVMSHLENRQTALAHHCTLPTVVVLTHMWKLISGAPNLSFASSLDSFADSLMMMQFSSMVKRQLKKDVTVEDLSHCKTIQDQAELIDLRSNVDIAKTQNFREPVSALQSTLCVRDGTTISERTKEAIMSLLGPRQLCWNDVEDVVPLPDWDAIFCHRSRPTSWNLRFVYHAPVSAAVLETAIKKSLDYHSTLRSLALQDKDGEILLVTVKTSAKWFKGCMTTGWRVNSKHELETLLLDDPILDAGVTSGPLVRFHIAEVLSDESSGLVFVGSHAVHDMTMTKLWLEDIEMLLEGRESPVPHVPFTDYASAFLAHRNGAEATAGVRYWACKLRGVGLLPETAYWPLQRTAEWFKGADCGWANWDGTPAQADKRVTPLPYKLQAQVGLRRRALVADIHRLKAAHGVPVFMLVKAALALVNVAHTHAPEAIFGVLNAARSWPFAADYSDRERAAYGAARNPLDISGCTTEYVLDRVTVRPQQCMLDFLRDVARGEQRNSRFAHAPFRRIVERLREPVARDVCEDIGPGDEDGDEIAEDFRTPAERERDAAAVLPLIRRQSFNWLPMAPTAADSGGKGLRLLGMRSRMDNGLTTTGFLADDKRSVVLSMSWDAEHLTFAEAERALEMLAVLVERMGKEDNWGLTIEEIMRV